MPVGVAKPAVGHAAAVIGGAARNKAPLEVTKKDDPPPAEAEPIEGDEADEEDGEEDDEKEEGEGGDGQVHDDGGEEEDEDEEEEGERWLKHYSSMQNILLVGDGDFSFSLALATAFRSGANIVATSLDTYEDLKVKYSKAESNIAELERLGARILHGIDVKMMRLHTELKSRRFDRVVFNFPHAGFKGKEDQVHLIKLHQNLLRSFFHNALHMLRPYGEIHVSHKMGQPYDRWNLELLAAEVSLVMFEKVCFQKEDYPGYNNKRGSGSRCDEPFPLGPCCTFKFQIGDLKKHKKPNQNRAGPVSLIGSHNACAESLTNNISIAQSQQPGFSLNFNGPARPLDINHQCTIQPMFSMLGPSLNAFPAPGGNPPVIGCITRPLLLAPQEQPWYMQRSIAGPPGRDNYSYFDHQLRLQREHEMQRQAMMSGATGLMFGATGLICSSAFLDDRSREYVPPGRVNYSYFDRQLCLQREHEMQRQEMMPGATGLIYSSALEDCRREYVQKQDWLRWKFIGTR